MTKEEIREIIDSENGKDFSFNINLNGYVFTKNGSFIVFEFKNVEGIKICHIKYIHFNNEKDLITILSNCCNFWMGNGIRFIFYKEKERDTNSPIEILESLNFRKDIIDKHLWKYEFDCNRCHNLNKHKKCECRVFNLYK